MTRIALVVVASLILSLAATVPAQACHGRALRGVKQGVGKVLKRVVHPFRRGC